MKKIKLRDILIGIILFCIVNSCERYLSDCILC
jgi:hypothetical protein